MYNIISFLQSSDCKIGDIFEKWGHVMHKSIEFNQTKSIQYLQYSKLVN
jgi:hypothetical protein